MPGHDEKKNPFKLRAFTGCLGQFIHFAVAEVADKRAGSESVLTKLSELMFVDVVRRYIVTLPQQDTGGLAGLRDPALASSHGAHPDSRALAWSGSPALLSDIPTTQRLSWSDFAPIRLRLTFSDVSNIEQRAANPGVHAGFITALAPASTGH